MLPPIDAILFPSASLTLGPFCKRSWRSYIFLCCSSKIYSSYFRLFSSAWAWDIAVLGIRLIFLVPFIGRPSLKSSKSASSACPWPTKLLAISVRLPYSSYLLRPYFAIAARRCLFVIFWKSMLFDEEPPAPIPRDPIVASPVIPPGSPPRCRH